MAELNSKQIKILKKAGLSEQEIVDLPEEDFKIYFPQQASPKEPIDFNPIPKVGQAAKYAGNFLDIPAGFTRSLFYKGDLSGATESPGHQKFKDSIESLGEGEFMKALGQYGEALDTGLPRSEEYLKQAGPIKSDEFNPLNALKSMYQITEGHPKTQAAVGFASDVLMDPLNMLGSMDAVKLAKYKGIPLNPDTAIGNVVEGVGKGAYKLPFKPIDTKLRQRGYEPFSELAYDEGFGGSWGGMNNQTKEFINKTTDETKNFVRDLGQNRLVTGETETLREPLVKALRDQDEGLRLSPLPNTDKLESDINYWTANAPRNEENFLTVLAYKSQMERYAAEMKEYNKGPKFTIQDGQLVPTPRPVPPETPMINQEGLPIDIINDRKSKLNKMMRSKEFDLTSDYVNSEVKDNMRRIRDEMQGLEERSINEQISPEATKYLKRENSNLRTAIEAENYLNRAETGSIFDVRNLFSSGVNSLVGHAVVPGLTKPPQWLKAARESTGGGYVDGAIRRGLFDTLGILGQDERDKKKKLSPEK